MKLPLLFAALLLSTSTAVAGPCVALDYQEMKDMSTEQLTKEACNVARNMSQALDEGMENLDANRGNKPFPNAQENFDQCKGQADRIDRILEMKGVSREALREMCRAQDTAHKAQIQELLNRRR